MVWMYLKHLALGADAVIIARPFVTAVYGGAEEGVKVLYRKAWNRTGRYDENVRGNESQRDHQSVCLDEIITRFP